MAETRESVTDSCLRRLERARQMGEAVTPRGSRETRVRKKKVDKVKSMVSEAPENAGKGGVAPCQPEDK